MAEEYLSVSALTRYITQKFDRDPYLGKVYLTGEISNYRLKPGGHQYFSLKDEQAKISAVMYKSAFAKLKFEPQVGQKVLVTGRVGVYGPSGNYQITIDTMEPDGVGALYLALKQLQERLQKEGLFDAPKKPLPRFPKKIAVITSQSGAVIQDIRTTVKRRYPIAEITLFPTTVQGSLAADEIVTNLKWADSLDFDTIIVGRGGGSIEDLWPFNEEKVVRAIFNATTPIISSVGHETDTTTADLVADVRAATPTAAAELAVPKLVDVLQTITDNQQRLVTRLSQILQKDRQTLAKVMDSYIFKQPQRLYEGVSQKFDLAKEHLNQNFASILQNKKLQVRTVDERLLRVSPQNRLERERINVDQQKKDLAREMLSLVQDKQQQFGKLVAGLNMLSPLNVMSRGYSYVTLDERIIKDSQRVQLDDEITVHLYKGQLKAKVIERKTSHE